MLCITVDGIKRENKPCYLLWYFDINLLNHDSHIHAGQFIDRFSTYFCLPPIARPTRVTASTAALINNILTKNVDNIVYSDQGILVTDVTDHYPVLMFIGSPLLRSGGIHVETYIHF